MNPQDKSSFDWNFIRGILFFRVLQAKRMANSWGWYYAIPLLFITTLALIWLVEVTVQFHPVYIGLALCLLIAWLHNKRKDLLFLQKFGKNRFALLFSEYILLLLPLYILYGIKDKFIAILMAFIGSSIIVFWRGMAFKYTFNIIDFFGERFIHHHFFEWRTGLRKHGVLFFISYIVALAILFFMPYAIIFWSFYFLSFVADFYNPIEPLSLLQSRFHATKPHVFTRKTLTHSTLSHIALLPHYVITIVIKPEIWYIVVACIVIIQMTTLYSIYYKYSVYSYKKQLAANQIPVALFSLYSVLLPFSILIVNKQRQKAIKQINQCLR